MRLADLDLATPATLWYTVLVVKNTDKADHPANRRDLGELRERIDRFRRDIEIEHEAIRARVEADRESRRLSRERPGRSR